ncbi:MAG: hypothetical protein QW724_01230 [Nitrososphaerota archaeon]
MRCVRIDWLIDSGMLSPYSPIALICSKLKVRWLPYMDGYIYGPTPGITELLARTLSLLKPESMLDLFCGSGALSKLAYIMNVKNVKAVDIYVEAAYKNLGKLKNVKIEQRDALEIGNEEKYSILVADPPEEKIEELVNRFPRLKKLYVDVAIVWVGPYSKTGKVIKKLSRDKKCLVVEAWGDAIAVFWKTRKHKTLLEKAIKYVG